MALVTPWCTWQAGGTWWYFVRKSTQSGRRDSRARDAEEWEVLHVLTAAVSGDHSGAWPSCRGNKHSEHSWHHKVPRFHLLAELAPCAVMDPMASRISMAQVLAWQPSVVHREWEYPEKEGERKKIVVQGRWWCWLFALQLCLKYCSYSPMLAKAIPNPVLETPVCALWMTFFSLLSTWPLPVNIFWTLGYF